MQFVTISALSKSFSNGKKCKIILKDIDISINRREFVVLLGANGCGKTTLLNIIAGLIEPDRGEVLIAGKQPLEEKMGYVFQNYRDSLLPWKTNLENIAFPLELDNICKSVRMMRAKKLAKHLDLGIPLSNFPYQSSGGEQQLVAISREVIFSPNIFNKLCTSYSITKLEAWELLFILRDLNFIEIIPFH